MRPGSAKSSLASRVTSRSVRTIGKATVNRPGPAPSCSTRISGRVDVMAAVDAQIESLTVEVRAQSRAFRIAVAKMTAPGENGVPLTSDDEPTNNRKKRKRKQQAASRRKKRKQNNKKDN